MNETQVIISSLKHLLKKDQVKTILSVSYGNDRKNFEKFMSENNLDFELCHNCYGKHDVELLMKFRSEKPQKHLLIEAKGNNSKMVFYNFYTLLGQFICKTKTLSTYYWYAFAVPANWESKIVKQIENNAVFYQLCNLVTKNKRQGLFLYFVNDDGTVIEKNIYKLIKCKKATAK